MVARVVIYLTVMTLLGLCWMVEQHASSLLERHPLFQWLCSRTRVFKAHGLSYAMCE